MSNDFNFEIPIWPGSGSAVSGSTSWGYYDNEPAFQTDASKFATWAARSLGYPIVSVELIDKQFYDCFEEAIQEYGAQVNQFQIRENMLSAQGLPTSSNLTQQVINSTLYRTIELAKAYGAEVGTGGYLPWKTGSIAVKNGTQDYDLNALWADVSESGERIEIQKIHHYQIPAITRYYDPLATAGSDFTGLGFLEEFGFQNYSPAIGSYTLYPIYDVLLKTQQVEFTDFVWRSQFSFEIRNNKLRLFPIPTQDFNLWFEYVVVKDRQSSVIGTGTNSASGSAMQSDYSNIQYQIIPYSTINEVGKQWIRRFGLSLAKEKLGIVRAKYSQIPIPGAEISLDGEGLKSEAATEKDALIQQIRENLEEVSRRAQMEKKAAEEESLQNSLRNIPLPLYVF